MRAHIHGRKRNEIHLFIYFLLFFFFLSVYLFFKNEGGGGAVVIGFQVCYALVFRFGCSPVCVTCNIQPMVTLGQEGFNSVVCHRKKKISRLLIGLDRIETQIVLRFLEFCNIGRRCNPLSSHLRGPRINKVHKRHQLSTEIEVAHGREKRIQRDVYSLSSPFYATECVLLFERLPSQ